MSAGRRIYAGTHGGHPGGPDQWLDIPDTDHGEIVVLGPWVNIPTLELTARGPREKLIGVAYETIKGNQPLLRHEHKWGEGGSGKLILPTLCFHACDSARCSSQGKLIIGGGSYRVTERGIVG